MLAFSILRKESWFRHNILASESSSLLWIRCLPNSPTTRKQIEDDHISDLYASIRDGQHYHMNTMNQALEKLCQSGLVTYEVAAQNTGNLAELRHMLRQG